MTDNVRKVVTIVETESAIHAFVKMKNEGVSSIGIVNEEGRLTNTLSPSDLKGKKIWSLRDFVRKQKLCVWKRTMWSLLMP